MYLPLQLGLALMAKQYPIDLANASLNPRDEGCFGNFLTTICANIVEFAP